MENIKIVITKVTTQTCVCDPESVGLTKEKIDGMSDEEFSSYMSVFVSKCDSKIAITTHHIGTIVQREV